MADESGTPLRSLFAKFFVSWDTKGFNAGVAAVDGLFGKLQSLGQALVGGAVVGGMVALTRSVIHQGDELSTTSDRLGIATDSLQEWMYAADLSDVSQEEMTAGLRIFQRQLFEAANGGKEAAAAFAKMGVQVKGANGETIQTEDAIAEIADRFQEMTDPVEKTALAMKVFGRGGQALVPLLSRGSEGIAELREEFQALGGGLNDETIEAANKADDAFKRLRVGVKSLVSNAMLPFINASIRVATWLKDAIVKFREMSKGSEIVKAALIALTAVAVAAAAPILIAWAPVIATTLAWAAALTGVILILDDIITLFSGGESVIGDWIDQNFGEGTASSIVETVKGWWKELSAVLEEAREVGKGEFFADMKKTLSEISSIIHAIIDGFKWIANFRNGGKSDDWFSNLATKIGNKAGSTNDAKPTPFQFAPGVAPNEAGTGVGGVNLPQEQSLFGTMPGANVISSVPVAAPTVNTPAGAAGAQIQNIINLAVAPNAAPDPKLVPMIKGAVADALDQQNRTTAAGL